MISTRKVRGLRATAISLLGAVAATSASADPVLLQEGTATFSQALGSVLSPDQVYDGDFGNVNGWAIARDTNGNASTAIDETAVWETVNDVPRGTLTFVMHQLHMSTGRTTLGRFRWSVTTEDRTSFADGAHTGGDVTTTWTVLTDPVVTLPFGMTHSILPDDSILTGGAIPFTSVYQLEYELPFGGITGIRLEVMEDPSLPQDGPGQAVSNGNFLLTELVVRVDPTPKVPGLAAPAIAVLALSLVAIGIERLRRVLGSA